MQYITLLFAFLLAVGTSHAQEDCTTFLPSEPGAVWETTHYNAKGKMGAKIRYELTELLEEGNSLVFKVDMTAFNKNGKEVYNRPIEYTCEDGKFRLDGTWGTNMSLFNGVEGFERMSVYQEVPMHVEAPDFFIPSLNTPVGTKLDDATVTMTIETQRTITTETKVTDRKIEAKESITTSAGTFECMVLSQTTSARSMLTTFEVTWKEWYAPNVGVVRTEYFDKKGKLTSYFELTKLEQ